MRTIKPVSGITAIKPAREGSFFPNHVHRVIINKLINSLIMKRNVNISFLY